MKPLYKIIVGQAVGFRFLILVRKLKARCFEVGPWQPTQGPERIRRWESISKTGEKNYKFICIFSVFGIMVKIKPESGDLFRTLLLWPFVLILPAYQGWTIFPFLDSEHGSSFKDVKITIFFS